jgi:hypothetical protein
MMEHHVPASREPFHGEAETLVFYHETKGPRNRWGSNSAIARITRREVLIKNAS